MLQEDLHFDLVKQSPAVAAQTDPNYFGFEHCHLSSAKLSSARSTGYQQLVGAVIHCHNASLTHPISPPDLTQELEQSCRASHQTLEQICRLAALDLLVFGLFSLCSKRTEINLKGV